MDWQVDFNPELPTQKEKDDYKITLGKNVYSGHPNGLTVWLDVETWDYGYTPATGEGHQTLPLQIPIKNEWIMYYADALMIGNK